MHEHYPEHDAGISSWFASHGWSVTRRHSDFDREILAWRAEGVSPSITLRITRSVIEDYSPNELAGILDFKQTAQRLVTAPDKYTVLKASNSGPVELVQLELPKGSID